VTTTDGSDRTDGTQTGQGRRTRNSEGSMTLVEHLRELRNRVAKAALAIAIGAVVAWIFYDRLFAIIVHPFDDVIAQARADGRVVVLALNGVTDAFTLKLQVALVGGIMLASPVWLYQLWRFISPGLKGGEKKWAYGFALAATPLFLAGAALGYYVLPRLLGVLLAFTPNGVENIISIEYYLTFFLQLMLFFGISFLIPMTFVMLNFAGILSARRLLSWWRGLVFGTFVFAAVATPTGDPINMAMVALPMLVLVGIAVLIMVINDKRRSRRRPADERYEEWDDDSVSPLVAAEHDPADDTPSALADEVGEPRGDSTR
jgi:sec-independent protein translocase protein TatC